MVLDADGNEVDEGLPLEVLLLEMANYDPLRAQEIEEKLNRRWFEWWSVDRKARAKANPKR